MMNRALWTTLALLTTSCLGCATEPPRDFALRHETIEGVIAAEGLSDAPEIAAARDQLEAPLARARGLVPVDEIELRAEVLHERDEKTRLLARVPIKSLFQIPTEKAIVHAEAEVALANLEEVTLDQRVRACRPSLTWLLYAEQQRIYDAYATRQRSLLARNRKQRESGLLDELRAVAFDLTGEVALSRRVPALPPETRGPILAVLPEIDANASALVPASAVIREQLESNQPSLATARARSRRYTALANHEAAGRLPSLRFVDVSVEADPYPGDKRQLGGQLSFEVPFGFEARARSKQYAALARGEENTRRAVMLERSRAARDAIEAVNAFRSQASHWLELLERANAAEATADRWFANRAANPSQVSKLIDDVYRARMTVLDARAAAGRAGCELLSAAGTGVDAWPEAR